MIVPAQPGLVLFPEGRHYRCFEHPLAVLEAHSLSEVKAVLAEAGRQVAQGRWVAGFLAYEAGAAFEAALPQRDAGPTPLAWFGVYDAPQLDAAPAQPSPPETVHWTPALDEAAYAGAVAAIRAHIAAGDTYQVNFTFPLHAAAPADTRAWFDALAFQRHGGHMAYVDTGRFAVLSLSPESFFTLAGDQISCRPMKGTRPRGRWPQEDAAIAEALGTAEKDRAENLMIVDMVRNDLGRIARNNTVRVPALFTLEPYPTVWQMTSTITAETTEDLPAIFEALFPSASVTGAPKIQACTYIDALESAPRGVYCGSIGWWGPERQARFNVAIRTITVDRETGTASYPVGSGIVWDSDTQLEYAECRQKAAALQAAPPCFELLETLRHDAAGYHFLEEHLDRIEASARHFGWTSNRAQWRDFLNDATGGFPEAPIRVRFLVDVDGRLRLEHFPLPEPRPWRVCLAEHPVDHTDVFLYHKTTHRKVYEALRAAHPDCDDVLLWNEAGALTESCFGNVVLDLDGQRVTPPVSQGLLAGVFRRHLLEIGQIVEAPLHKDDLQRATQVWIINSVRGWVDVELSG